jgi:trehalose/maltose hydrolase-like predicted phosphorylase
MPSSLTRSQRARSAPTSTTTCPVPPTAALLLARAGRPDEALELFDLAGAVDFEDITQTAGGGVHLANLGGVWQALVHGFAGVRVRRPDDRFLSLDPVLPERWAALRFRVTWHGRRLAFECSTDRVRVRCDQPVRIELHGTVHEVRPPGAVLS